MQFQTWSKQTKKLFLANILLTITFTIVGLLVFDDFGLAVDSSIARNNAVYAYRFLKGDNSIDAYADKYYATALELPLIFLEKITAVKSIREVFLLRYLTLYLLFLTALISFSYYLYLLFHKWWVSVVGYLALVLYPRIFVDAFTNSKDLGLFIFVIFCFTSLTFYIKKQTLLRAVLHGFILGLTIAVRPVALIYLPLFLIFITKNIVTKKQFKYLWHTVVFGAATVAGILILWPYLWPDPIVRFMAAITLFSKYPFPGNVLYLGEYIKAGQTPWHYLPVWIIVTVPSAILGFMVLGLTNAVVQFFIYIKKHKFKQDFIHICVALYWVLVPIMSIIMLKSVVYDGWRHMYFIYPGLVVIAVFGILWVWKIKKNQILFRISVLVVLLLQTLSLILWTIRTHPNEHVYFSWIVGGMARAKENFDLDYWALSYRKCMEEILKKDKRDTISVFFRYSKLASVYILPEDLQKRIVEVDDPLQANYFFSNYREHKEEYPVQTAPACEVVIDGTRIAVVYRIKR